jgi:hypothetical protein
VPRARPCWTYGPLGRNQDKTLCHLLLSIDHWGIDLGVIYWLVSGPYSAPTHGGPTHSAAFFPGRLLLPQRGAGTQLHLLQPCRRCARLEGRCRARGVAMPSSDQMSGSGPDRFLQARHPSRPHNRDAFTGTGQLLAPCRCVNCSSLVLVLLSLPGEAKSTPGNLPRRGWRQGWHPPGFSSLMLISSWLSPGLPRWNQWSPSISC